MAITTEDFVLSKPPVFQTARVEGTVADTETQEFYRQPVGCTQTRIFNIDGTTEILPTVVVGSW